MSWQVFLSAGITIIQTLQAQRRCLCVSGIFISSTWHVIYLWFKPSYHDRRFASCSQLRHCSDGKKTSHIGPSFRSWLEIETLIVLSRLFTMIGSPSTTNLSSSLKGTNGSGTSNRFQFRLGTSISGATSFVPVAYSPWCLVRCQPLNACWVSMASIRSDLGLIVDCSLSLR